MSRRHHPASAAASGIGPQSDASNPALHHPVSVDRIEIFAVLGMHSSGTSVTTGMLEEQGVDLGDVDDTTEATWRHVKGTRENEPLVGLGRDVLRYSGGSWRDPPRGQLRYSAEHLMRRNDILATFTQSPCAIKDPSTLLLLDFWRDVPLRFVGVIRNPVSVARSLVYRTRRARRSWRTRLWYLRRGEPALSFRRAVGLWTAYNSRLLGELRRESFPVINFDESANLEAQVRAALAFYGHRAANPFSFFEAEAVAHDRGDWCTELDDRDAAELWDELKSYTGLPSGSGHGRSG